MRQHKDTLLPATEKSESVDVLWCALAIWHHRDPHLYTYFATNFWHGTLDASGLVVVINDIRAYIYHSRDLASYHNAEGNINNIILF